MRQEVTFDCCAHAVEDAEIYKDEISEFILGEMEDTFNCSLEDGSDEEVGDGVRYEYRLLKSFCLFTILPRMVICL